MIDLPDDSIVKLAGGRYYVPVRVTRQGERLILQFPFNQALLAEVKAMDGSRWHPDDDERYWSVKDSERNRFQLAHLAGLDPYAWYDRELPDLEFTRPLYGHQKDMVAVGLGLRRVLLAAEQGLGKSLAGIEIMERSGAPDWFYIGPRSAIASFEIELFEWASGVVPSVMTYERLQRMIDNWPPGRPVPQGVLFDECQRIKTPTSGRSIAAYRLAEAMRREWGANAYVIGLSGTPAPKDPTDYHHQCEVICPGFIREGNRAKFEARLSLIKKIDGPAGSYPKRVCWFDDSRRCKHCGLFQEDHSVEEALLQGSDYHKFEESVNEVAYLSERLAGLVWVYRKADCLKELPELRFRQLHAKPSEDVLSAAKLVVAGAETAISGFTRLRELSDGFLYSTDEVGRQACPKCAGALVVEQHVPVVDDEALETALEDLYRLAAEGGVAVSDDQGMPIPEYLLLPDHYELQVVECWRCGGQGDVAVHARVADKIETPKDDLLRTVLDAHDDDGRLVVFCGFTESVDRVTGVLDAEKWEWVRLDGRGWSASPGITAKSSFDLLRLFQKGQEQHPRVCFVGQADAAGTGLTLTASSELVYYSNTFNGDARLQSEHRIHRPGMDVNKGALITDFIHLPSDEVVLKNLKQKKRLQDLSLGVLSEGLE